MGPKHLVLTFLTDWCKTSGLYLVPVPNYWTRTKTTPQKKRFFWSNPYKVEVMITFLIQMLELPNFGHMTTSIIWVMWQNFVGDVIDRIYGVITFISKHLYFKKGWCSHFADILNRVKISCAQNLLTTCASTDDSEVS